MFRRSALRLVEQSSATATAAKSQLPPSMLTRKPKPEGDISSVFASLSKEAAQPLPDRYITLKNQIVGENMEQLYDSWKALLRSLKMDLEIIQERKNTVIPVLDFDSLDRLTEHQRTEIRHRGVAVVRGVFQPNEALSFKEKAKQYIKANPSTKGFPAENPQVYELYWSPSQVSARADPRMISVQKFFLSLWHSYPSSSSPTPLAYADRFRIRHPGDSKFALGPHVDGGGVERWEDPVYRGVYKKIFEGKWWEYDAYDVGGRGEESVRMSMYDCAGGCTVFRAWQGWVKLSMSSTGPNEGTLRVLPLTRTATAYWLLRPFFSPSTSGSPWWEPTPGTPFLHGVNPDRGQEMNEELHPHLELGKSMMSVPRVEPGDVVMWQGDLIHAVESHHSGSSDSSVMYIPSTPSTPLNRTYIAAQRESFMEGSPPPDFPGGKGEQNHVGRGTREMISEVGGDAALHAMGF